MLYFVYKYIMLINILININDTIHKNFPKLHFLIIIEYNHKWNAYFWTSPSFISLY